MLMSSLQQAFQLFDMDMAVVKADNALFAPVLQLSIDDGADRADHFCNGLMGEVIDKSDIIMPWIMTIEMAKQQFGKPGFGIMKGKVPGKIGKSVHLFAKIGKKGAIEIGMSRNPQPCLLYRKAQ